MIMLLKYQGNGYRVSFVPNQIYKAQKVHVIQWVMVTQFLMKAKIGIFTASTF